MALPSAHLVCDDGNCCDMPPEFVRLRYYFGQRLGVVDLVDEQAYHAGKQRFHTARAHGVGVLCGLRPERFVWPQGAPADTATTVLRVSRGAALDPCGREVLVGVDQCIDVAAWYQKHKQRPDVAAWLDVDAPAPALWVALRYLECPTDPGPAPRDPCGCDAGGCEYGRVREGFELALLTGEELDQLVGPPQPAPTALRAAIERAGGDVDSAFRALTAGACPQPTTDGWLALARLSVQLGGDGPTVVDIGAPDLDIPARLVVMPTHALQTLAVDGAAGVLGVGPRYGAVSFEADAADPLAAGTVRVAVELADDVAIAAGTFDPAMVAVRRLSAAGAWEDAAPTEVALETAPSPHVRIRWDSGLAADTAYRLTIVASAAEPIADERARELAPRELARTFLLADDGGALALADPA